MARLPLDLVRSPVRSGELPVDPSVPNPSRHRPSPRTVLGPVIVGEDQDRSVCGVRSADTAPAMETSSVPNSR
jgi:hypothetical protein